VFCRAAIVSAFAPDGSANDGKGTFGGEKSKVSVREAVFGCEQKYMTRSLSPP
jgi:hypothetical protein